MPQQPLSEIVNSALQQAANQVKVASLREAPIQDRGFQRLDNYLAEELGQVERVQPQTTKQASAAPAQSGGGLDDVHFALKLAEALVHGANAVTKLAGPLNKSDGGAPTPGPTPAGGPVDILPQPHFTDRVVSPKPQASAHARAAQANKGLTDGLPDTDEGYQDNSGPVIPSNYPTSRVPTTGARTKKAHKQAVERLLQSKIAQHQMLVSLGQIDAANAVAAEARKIAAESAVGGSTPIFGDDYNSAKVMPDNEGVRRLTKAQARDANQREAGNFFGEPVKRDNAVAAHSAVTDGLKLSALNVLRRKLAEDDDERPKRRSTGTLAAGNYAVDRATRHEGKEGRASWGDAIGGIGGAVRKTFGHNAGKELRAATKGLKGKKLQSATNTFNKSQASTNKWTGGATLAGGGLLAGGAGMAMG